MTFFRLVNACFRNDAKNHPLAEDRGKPFRFSEAAAEGETKDRTVPAETNEKRELYLAREWDTGV